MDGVWLHHPQECKVFSNSIRWQFGRIGYGATILRTLFFWTLMSSPLWIYRVWTTRWRGHTKSCSTYCASPWFRSLANQLVNCLNSFELGFFNRACFFALQFTNSDVHFYGPGLEIGCCCPSLDPPIFLVHRCDEQQPSKMDDMFPFQICASIYIVLKYTHHRWLRLDPLSLSCRLDILSTYLLSIIFVSNLKYISY